MSKQRDKTNKKNNKIALILSIAAIAMFGFGFLLVPLYNVLCSALGINGKTDNIQAVAASQVDQSRTVEIVFLSHTQSDLPWDFYPVNKKLSFHPGENKRIAYMAKNKSGKPMTVQAIPSVTPGIAAKYLKKTECFCFTQQTLEGQESMEMPILFHIDKDLPKDIHQIALSYTLFDVTNRKKKVSGKPLRRISE